jgi:hypothetical protein
MNSGSAYSSPATAAPQEPGPPESRRPQDPIAVIAMILMHANRGFMNTCRSRSENKRRASPMPSGSTTPKYAVNGILYVLRTGWRWEDVLREYGSSPAC